MKKIKEIRCRWKAMAGMLVLMLAFAAGLSAGPFKLVSHAESAAKVTATSAKIRKEPSTSSDTLGSAAKDATLSVKGKTTGSDGQVWYQVYVDANTLGYVRSDLVEITDGSTPAETAAPVAPSAPTAPTTANTATPDQELAPVTAVEPASGSVKGGQAVRVRQNASTSSRIVTTAESGMALTVTGTATGTDGNEWYQVTFISNSSEVNGFIRADYVSLSGELTPVGAEPDPGVEQPDSQDEPVAQDVKDWDTYYDGEKWHLLDNTTGNAYDIASIFTISSDNRKIAEDALNAKKTQQIVIIVLVIILVGLAAVATYLIFKLRDMTDAAYFNDAERESARRRTADRPSGSGQRVMQTVGDDRRPTGQRPSGGAQRPTGQRPPGSGNSGQGQRPSGNGAQRPTGQRPAGSQGQRPSGSGAQRPTGQRPSGSGNSGQGQRPVEQRPVSQRPEAAQQQGGAPQGQGWKSKNFAAEEDEFKFLDWDGGEE